MQYEQEVFEKEHADLEGKSFLEVYNTRKQWVEFTLIWTEASGRYKLWWEYCKAKQKQDESNQSSPE